MSSFEQESPAEGVFRKVLQIGLPAVRSCPWPHRLTKRLPCVALRCAIRPTWARSLAATTPAPALIELQSRQIAAHFSTATDGFVSFPSITATENNAFGFTSILNPHLLSRTGRFRSEKMLVWGDAQSKKTCSSVFYLCCTCRQFLCVSIPFSGAIFEGVLRIFTFYYWKQYWLLYDDNFQRFCRNK